MKRILRSMLFALLLSVLLSLFCLPSSALSGAGTEASPYLIGTASDLETVAANVNGESSSQYAGAHYKLTADIVANTGHTPIGTEKSPFTGHFDGDGHSVTLASTEVTGYRGLFGFVSGGTVCRLSLIANQLDGGKKVFGAIAGELDNGATLSQCAVSGSLSGGNSPGGLVGVLAGCSTVADCLCTAKITVNGVTGGGLVGDIKAGTVLRSLFAGSAVTDTDKKTFGAIAATASENASAQNTYYPADYSALADSTAFTGATALDSSAMKNFSNFVGFSSTVWSISAGDNHPKLSFSAGQGGHSHLYTSTTVSPTCTEEGYTLFSCTCGDSYRTNTVAASGHKIAAYETLTEPTCFEVGEKQGYCTACKQTVTKEMPKLPHTEAKDPEISPDLIQAAGCETDGSLVKIWYCSVCAKKDIRTEVRRETVTIPASHKWVQTAVITQVTCLVDGEITEECSVCRKTQNTTVKAVGYHDYHEIRTESKCLVDGKVEKVCSACKDTVLLSVIPRLNHNYSVTKTVFEANCIEEGKLEKTCANCKDVIEIIIPALGHQIPHYTVDRPAGCDTEGEKTGYCLRCKETVTEIFDKLDHIPGEKHRENESPATCSSEGSYDEVIRCTVCNGILSSVPCTEGFADHMPSELISVELQAAKCLTGGYYLEKIICEVCKEPLREEYIISDPLGHKIAKYEVTKAPTCLAEGTQSGKCSVCLETVNEAIPASGHTSGDIAYENITPATCTEGGSYDEVNRCVVCKTEISRTEKTTSASGHSPLPAVSENVIPAQCLISGSYDEVIYCETCKNAISRISKTLSASGHTPGEEASENIQKPSCTLPGSYEAVICCAVCTEEISRTQMPIEPTGHHFSNPETVTIATCLLAGEKRGYCSDCSQYTSEVIPPLGHKPAAEVREKVENPTCTEPGSYDAVIYCSRCENELSRTQMPIEPTGHHFSSPEIVTEPTCVLAGEKRGYCSGCSQYTSEAIPALNHQPGEAVRENTVNPACLLPGSYDDVVYCLRCKEEISRNGGVIPPSGHSPAEAVRENEVAALCASSGSYDAVVYCAKCKAELSRKNEFVPALSHSFGDPVVEIPASCTGLGKAAKTCAVCKVSVPVYTDPIGHNYKISVVKPTVDAGGYTLHFCEACGASYQTDFTDPIDPSEYLDAAKIADFCEAVDTAAAVSADGELFAPVQSALKLYLALSDEEKKAVSTDYERLLSTADRYNAYADGINEKAKEASHAALLSLVEQFSLIGLLWIYLRDFFFNR